MAQRLATAYVKTCLKLTEADLVRFVQLFAEHQVKLQVKVLENGSQEFVVQDHTGEEIVLTFQHVSGEYVCQASCKLFNAQIANALRKAVSLFKGDAVVERIYRSYTMVYSYKGGAVARIVEVKNGQENIIYEYKDTLGELERLFGNKQVEEQISSVREQINILLDQRNRETDGAVIKVIDDRLHRLTHQLFVLEA